MSSASFTTSLLLLSVRVSGKLFCVMQMISNGQWLLLFRDWFSYATLYYPSFWIHLVVTVSVRLCYCSISKFMFTLTGILE